LLPAAGVSTVQQPLLFTMRWWLDQVVVCAPFTSAHNQEMREGLLRWLREAVLVTLESASQQLPTSPTWVKVPQVAAKGRSHRRLGPGPKLPPRYRAAGGAASRRKGRRSATRAEGQGRPELRRPRGLGSVRVAGRRRRVCIAGWRRRLARVIRRARVTPRVSWTPKFSNIAACHVGDGSDVAGESAREPAAPPWLGGDGPPQEGTATAQAQGSSAVAASAHTVTGLPQAWHAEMGPGVALETGCGLPGASHDGHPHPSADQAELDGSLQEGIRVFQ